MKNNKVFVLGGTGFIGSAVSKELLEAGCEVGILHRGHHPLPGESVFEVQGDRLDVGWLRKVITEFAPDVIIDLIAYTASDAWALRQVSRDLTGHVTVVSSGDVYRAYQVFRHGGSALEKVPLREISPLRDLLFPYRDRVLPDTPENELFYNYDKILVEQLLLAAPEFDTTILRLPAVYGENDEQHKLSAYLRPMLEGKNRIQLEESKANWRWSRGYVRNVAHGIVLAALREVGEDAVYNLGEEEVLTEQELIRLLARLTGWEGKIELSTREELPADQQRPFNYAQHLVLDTSRIRRDLDYQALFDRETGLRHTIAYETTVLEI